MSKPVRSLSNAEYEAIFEAVLQIGIDEDNDRCEDTDVNEILEDEQDNLHVTDEREDVIKFSEIDEENKDDGGDKESKPNKIVDDEIVDEEEDDFDAILQESEKNIG